MVDIDRYTVSSAVRGKGVGARMMAYMTAWCWTIYPHVQSFRVRAPQSRGFYHSLGFTNNGQDLVLKVSVIERFNGSITIQRIDHYRTDRYGLSRTVQRTNVGTICTACTVYYYASCHSYILSSTMRRADEASRH